MVLCKGQSSGHGGAFYLVSPLAQLCCGLWGFIHVMNISVWIWVRELLSLCLYITPVYCNALMLIGTTVTRIFLTLIMFVSYWMLGLDVPGNCRQDIQRCCHLPGVPSLGLHPACIHSGSLCIMLFSRSLLLTCHCGRWWD